jgi:hypothetical protein
VRRLGGVESSGRVEEEGEGRRWTELERVVG